MKTGCSRLKRNSVCYFALITFIFCISVLHAPAQENVLIEAQSMVDTAEITIGDQITYTVVIDRHADLRIAKPGEGVNLGMFQIKDYEFHEPREKDGRIIERYEYTISVYDTGKYTIPPFPVAYFPEDTSKAYKVIEAPAIDIFVKSVISGDEARELKDVKPPIDIPFNYVFWISVAVAGLLLLVVIYLLYLVWKRRREKGYIFSPPPPPPPCHEVALDALQELYASDLLSRKDYKTFFTRLSGIMRIYLEGRFFIAAMEETTAEIMRDLAAHLEDDKRKTDIELILTSSDLVKFAKHIPDEESIGALKDKAVHFINDTKIVYEKTTDTEGNAEGEESETKQELLTDGQQPDNMK